MVRASATLHHTGGAFPARTAAHREDRVGREARGGLEPRLAPDRHPPLRGLRSRTVTRYDRLCDLYAAARARAEARRERCAVLVERMSERLRSYMGAPADALCFNPIDSEPEDSQPVPLREAMSAADDGTWQVRIQVSLRDPAKPDAPFSVFFGVRVRDEDGRLRLSLSDEDPGREVDPDDAAALDAVAADAHRRLEQWLVANLDRALGAAGTPDRFGGYL